MVNNVLVIQCKAVLPQEKLKILRGNILKQKETGVIVLPPYCDAILVPDDILIKFMDKEVKHDSN